MRLDVIIKQPSDIEPLNQFLSTHSFTQVNITEKQPQQWLYPLLHQLHAPHICVHLSAKHHQENFLESFHLAQQAGIHSFLIISGIPRHKKDSLSLLSTIDNLSSSTKIAIAYTPFARDQSAERLRLQKKLASGIISEIYLQMGDNEQKLTTEISWLRMQTKAPLIASLLVPTPALREKFIHSQWYGIEFDRTSLATQEAAFARMRALHSFYKQYVDDILLEMFPFTAADFQTYCHPYLNL